MIASLSNCCKFLKNNKCVDNYSSLTLSDYIISNNRDKIPEIFWHSEKHRIVTDIWSEMFTFSFCQS